MPIKEIQTELINVYTYWISFENEIGRFLKAWIKKKIALYRGVWNDNIIFSSGFVYSYQYHDKDDGVNKIICENTHQ